MHVGESAGRVQNNTCALAPLQRRQALVTQPVVERASIHVLKHKAAARAVEGDAEEPIDVWVEGAAKKLDLGFYLPVFERSKPRIFRQAAPFIHDLHCDS